MPSRRQFLTSLAAGALAAGAGAFLGREARRALDRGAPPDPGLGPVVTSPASRTRVGLLALPRYDAGEILRELRRIVPEAAPAFVARVKGARVLLKPNLVEVRAGAPVHTDPAVVLAAVELCRALGAAEVLVGEGPGHRRDAIAVADEAGLLDALRGTGARFLDLNRGETATRSLASRRSGLASLAFPAAVLGADLLVSLPKLKTHHWARATLGMKNLFGVVPGCIYGWPKNLLHQRGIDACIADLAATLPPALTIVDGIVGMEGDGPILGTPVPSGALIVGEGVASVDATAARCMGLDPRQVPHIARAPASLGPTRPEAISLVGERLERLQRPYAPAPAG